MVRQESTEQVTLQADVDEERSQQCAAEMM